MIALVDGVPCDSLPVSDSAVLRGDGCFEAIRSYAGRPFALGPHLDRLAASARSLGLPLPDRASLEGWCRRVAAEGGEGIVRVVVTRGDAIPGATEAGRSIVVHHPLPSRLESVRLLPVAAPWHPAGRDWELAGAKTLSYAPNLAAGRRAREAGFDDALLVSDDGVVLEGPTFTVAWAVEGTLITPALDLHILASITRGIVLELAARLLVPVEEGRFPLEAALRADEVMAMSTTKEVLPVVALGEQRVSPGPLTGALRRGFAERVAQEISPQGGVGR